MQLSVTRRKAIASQGIPWPNGIDMGLVNTCRTPLHVARDQLSFSCATADATTYVSSANFEACQPVQRAHTWRYCCRLEAQQQQEAIAL